VVALVAIASVLAVSVPAVQAWRVGGPIAGGVSLTYVLVADVVVIAAAGWLIWHLAAMTLTIVDEEGISAPRLLGRPVVIRWSEVTEISGGDRLCEIRTKTKRVRLSSLHTGGEDLVAAIRKFAPAGTLR
jgi:hypothetical protein